MVSFLREEVGSALLRRGPFGQHQLADLRCTERESGLIEAPGRDNSSSHRGLCVRAAPLRELKHRFETHPRAGGRLLHRVDSRRHSDRPPLQARRGGGALKDV
jgi:hypothetical protein